MIKLKNILEENYSHIRYLVSDLKNLYYEVDDTKLKNIIIDLIPNGSYYQYTPNKADFYIKKFDELEKLSKKVLKPNNPAFKTIQKIIKGGLEFWNQKESVNETNLYNMIKLTELLTEGKNWAKMMAGVRKGSQSGPWTIVVSRNKKVVYQRQVKVKDAIPANFEDIKNTSSLKGDIYAIEDNEGMIVYYEKI